MKEQIGRWNFKTVQGQQLTKKQGRGKMYNTLQIFSQHFIKRRLCGQCRDKVSFQALGHTNVLHPSNIKTFRLPVAHKTVELFEPSACLSALSSLLSLFSSHFPHTALFHQQVFKKHSGSIIYWLGWDQLVRGCSTRGKNVRYRFNLTCVNKN